MDFRNAIRLRHSTRRYDARPVPAQALEQVTTRAANAERLLQRGVRVTLVNGQEQVAQILKRIAGIYGLVQGAPHLLVGLVPEETDEPLLELGYVLEQAVLEATRLGVATCWMTGSYRADRAAVAVDIRPGETAAAVAAMGYPRTDRLARVHDEVVHRLAGAGRRRSLEQIVFDGQWGRPWSPEGADPVLVEMLECARLAPSAVNRQPWRFVVEPGRISLALTRSAPIDAGITMAHVAVAAAELDSPGHWTVRLGDPELADRLRLPASAVPVGVWRRP
jgi:nitroreductase